MEKEWLVQSVEQIIENSWERLLTLSKFAIRNDKFQLAQEMQEILCFISQMDNYQKELLCESKSDLNSDPNIKVF